MDKLHKALDKCMKQCDKLKIPYGRVLWIEPSKRVTKQWGCCRVSNFGSMITVNKRLLEPDISEDALINTVMHELLHTCPGCANHGAKWKRYASMVNKAYGCNIKRCTAPSEKGIDELPRPVAKYRFMCQKCGTVVSRQRASSFTKNPSGYVCGKCGGKFIAL